MMTRTKTGCALLLTLGLGACGGAARQPSSMPTQRASYSGGESSGVEAVSVQSDDEDEMNLDRASADSPGYEPAPAVTGTMTSAPPPRAPTQEQPEPPHSMGMASEATIDVGPRFDRLLSLQGDLGGVLALSAPNCPRAHDLSAAICELSEHICTIADDNPDARDARDRCRDGRDRCVRAREQVSEGCGE
ncbi:MAG: hypothetical protein GXP55_19325 [Deltaproteobacteria bacterium]|nr:hypothetical protein [Deltaproteobacteria bacterium]